MSDEEAPFRNLVFKFSLLEVKYASKSAVQDVETFRQLTKTRNSLAYGGSEDLDALPAVEARTLLLKYLAALAPS